MDPSLPPHPTTITANNYAITQLGYGNKVASPRFRPIEKMDKPLEPIPATKLRLMCSYGGHIIPHPHDKTLCYVGGETRIVVVDRNSSLSDVHSRLSHTLLSGRNFTLKYQLPNEELDNLVSVTTDEDMENMIEEYDRILSAAPLKPSRLRLFLFLAKPETAASMGALLDTAESWFVDALNSVDLLQRGVSDSAAIQSLLELDATVKGGPCFDIEAIRGADQEVHIAMPDSPMVETSSSFDSNISSQSMANILNVGVEDTVTRLQEHLSGLGEQLLHMHVASTSCIETTPSTVGDDRLDKAMLIGLRKPPLPLQPVQWIFADASTLPSPNSKNAEAYSLQSPDSVNSDGSLASPASHSKRLVYPDPPSPGYEENRFFPATNDLNNNIIKSSNKMQMKQAHDPVVLPPLQQIGQQQQFANSTARYIQHPPPNLMPISCYYPMYAALNQPQHHQHYPVFLMPFNQSKPFDTSTPSNPVSVAYINSNPPIYSAKTTTTTSPATQANSPKTIPGLTSPYIHVLPNQFQQQYYGVAQGHPPPHSIPSASTTTSKLIHNYGQEQLKYVQYLPSQYQPTTPATSVSKTQASREQSADNDTQQMQTSQPQ